AAMAGELEIIEQTIFSFANVRDEEGRYLFSGTLSDEPAVVYDEVTETYSMNGNDKHRQAAVANGVFVDENVTAIAVFGDMEMLNSLHGLINNFKNPALDVNDVRAAIENAIAELDNTHSRLLGTITELGGRQNSLTLLTNSNDDVSLVNQKIEGDLSKLDYAGATIDLQNYQLALQVTQKTYLNINELSLFNLL